MNFIERIKTYKHKESAVTVTADSLCLCIHPGIYVSN